MRYRITAELVRFGIPAPSGVTLSISPALSPDGKLAFLATGKDSMPMVWIRPLDSREARPLAGTDGATGGTLFWSPDSRFIAFWSGGKLTKIEAAGGPAQTICDAATANFGFWTPDNKIVFSGAATLMAQPFNPERLEFTGDAVPIAEQVGAFGGFSASAAGELAYRVAGAQTNRQLTWYDRQGKVLAAPGEAGEYGLLALSPDAAQVAYTRGTGLSLFEFARGVNTPFTFGRATI